MGGYECGRVLSVGGVSVGEYECRRVECNAVHVSLGGNVHVKCEQSSVGGRKCGRGVHLEGCE